MRTLRSMLVALAIVSSVFVVFGSLPTGESLGASTVTIYRDSFGVSHIYGPTAYAVSYANGYVQGLDRLWELDLLRHIGYGESASLVGASQLPMDLSTRRDLYTRAELDALWANAPADLKEAVEGYAAGVNRAAAEMTAKGDLPAEFPALQHAFEPWTARDTAAVATFLLARFGTGGGDEVSNLRLIDQLGSTTGGDGFAAFNDVVWGDPTGRAYSTIPASEGAYPNAGLLAKPKALTTDLVAEQAALLDLAADGGSIETFGLATQPGLPFSGPSSLVGPQGLEKMKWGSNALLVAPSLSADGRALVGGGPQTGYFNPQILYEVGLHGGGIDVVGVGVAGAPGVVLGRTANFAWTVTSGISDQTDTFALPAAGERSYTWDGEVRDLDCRSEQHRVITPPALGGGFDIVTQEVCFSHVGPVTAVATDGTGSITHFFAQKSSSREREIDSAAKWLRLDRATNLEEFAASFDGFAYTFNFHFAGKDAAGAERACYFHVGAQPLRNLDLDPRLPTPAGDAWDWSGELNGLELPNDCDPAQGYYANWNNYPQQGWTSGDSRELWGSLHRVEHLDSEASEFLAGDADGQLTLSDVKAILKNTATMDTLAAQIVPAVLAHDPGTSPAATAALNEWAAADYPWRAGGSVSNPSGATYDDKGHTVYDALLTQLGETILGDEQGAFLRGINLDPSTAGDPHAGDHGEHNNPYAVVVDALSGTTTHDWCDDVTTPGPETCADAVAAVLSQFPAGSNTSEIGGTPQHFTRFTSLGLGPAYTMPMTNRATYYHFHVGSDPTTSGSAIAPGQSGHVNAFSAGLMLGLGQPAPPNMRNQLPLYIGFTFKALPFSQATIVAAPSTLVVPEP